MSETNTDSNLYNDVLMAWPMAGFTGPLLDAHQHFFDTFGKFGAVITDDGRRRRAAQRHRCRIPEGRGPARD